MVSGVWKIWATEVGVVVVGESGKHFESFVVDVLRFLLRMFDW